MYTPYYKPQYGWLYRILIPLSSHYHPNIIPISIPISIPLSTAYILFAIHNVQLFMGCYRDYVEGDPLGEIMVASARFQSEFCELPWGTHVSAATLLITSFSEVVTY